MHFEQGERKRIGSLGPDVMGGPGRVGPAMAGKRTLLSGQSPRCDVWRPNKPDLRKISLASAVLVEQSASWVLPLIPHRWIYSSFLFSFFLCKISINYTWRHIQP